jgi:hypothetical protein
MIAAPQTRSAPKPAATRGPGGHARRATGPERIAVPDGLSAEQARRVLAAVARSVSAVAGTGHTVTLDVRPSARQGGKSGFLIVRSFPTDTVLPAPQAATDAGELSPAAARAALKRAYERGEVAAADLLAGPDMLSSDAMAQRLGISREAVHQKRRRGELLGIEGAKRGVRFPAWQLDADGMPLPALRDLHDALGAPWAVFRFLQQRHPELGMRTGLAAISDPRRAPDALALARSVGTFGPAGA